MVGFNVYWQDGVQVDSEAPYTGESPQKAETSPADASAAKQDIIRRTNQLRQEHGISALTVDQRMMEAAQVRAEEMAAASVYSHTRPNGGHYTTVTDCPYTAENIHRLSDYYLGVLQMDVAEAAMTEWSNSDGHLENLLERKADRIGVGLARGVNASGEDCWYCVQMFLWSGYSVTWVDTPSA